MLPVRHNHLGKAPNPEVLGKFHNIFLLNDLKFIFNKILKILISFTRALNSSIHSSSSGGFSTWGLAPQCAAAAAAAGGRVAPQENYYNNPLPCVGGAGGAQNRYQITPTGQHPPPLPPYFPAGGTGQLPPRNIHIHYPPPRHAVSEYQPTGTHNSRCSNGR